MKSLNREEFAAALKKGSGRAWWHVANYGLDEVADLVLEACLHTQKYDPQSESSQAAWLFEMFGKTVYYPGFHDAILTALRTEPDTWDSQQLCGLAKELAVHGDDGARQALRDYAFDKASRCASDDWLGANEWIELAGLEGFIDLAHVYGQRLLADSADNPGNLWWSDEEKPIFHTALLQQAPTDLAVAAYCKYLEARGAFTPRRPVDREMAMQERRQRVREEYPLDRILGEAKNGVGEYPGRYTTFGRFAMPEEVETVYAALLTAMNDAARVRLLWVFRRAPLPRLADVFFDWAMADNEELRLAAVEALAEVSDARVHALARSKIAIGQLIGADTEVLALFLHNYQREDAELINLALTGVKPETDEDTHSLGLNLLNLVERQAAAELTPALRWAYEHTPCTACRSSVVKLLDQFQALDEILRQECLHDAEEDTRAIAQQRLSASPLPPLLTTDDQPI